MASSGRSRLKHPIPSGKPPNGGGAGACVAATSGSSLIRLTRTLLRVFLLGAREPTLLIALSCYGTTRADYRALISSALSSFPFFYFFWFGHSEGRGMSTCQSDHSAAKNPEFMAHGYEDGRSSFVR